MTAPLTALWLEVIGSAVAFAFALSAVQGSASAVGAFYCGFSLLFLMFLTMLRLGWLILRS